MSSLDDFPLHYEDLDGTKLVKVKKGNKMSKATTKESKKQKSTLSVYTYLNFKRFGVMVSIDDGIKVNILVFETHIKFEKR